MAKANLLGVAITDIAHARGHYKYRYYQYGNG